MDGRAAEGWLRTGEGYAFTAASAVSTVEAVLASEPLGATTVAAAFGLEIALSAGGELLATACSQKENIGRAAVDCFAGQGYDGTRVRHIAERPAIRSRHHRHYASAEALAQELFAHYFGEYARQIADATSNGTTKHRLRAVIRTTLAFYRADPAAAIFILVRQDRFMPRLPAGTVYPLEIVERIIAVGQQKLELRPGRPQTCSPPSFSAACCVRSSLTASPLQARWTSSLIPGTTRSSRRLR